LSERRTVPKPAAIEADSIEGNAGELRKHSGALDVLVERREVRGDAHGRAAQTVSEPERERNSDAMTRAELIALASPPCNECGAPVQRVETRWHLDEDCRWRPGPYFMVCADEHRVLVQALE
jgi:hypothetical protein